MKKLDNNEEPGGRPLPSDPAALLFQVEAAYLLGLSPRTLESFRLRGGGPSFVSISRGAVRYRRCDLDNWIASRVRKTTSDLGIAPANVRMRSRRKVAAYQLEYQARNRDAIAARKREYYARNRDAMRAQQREYRARNRDAIAARDREGDNAVKYAFDHPGAPLLITAADAGAAPSHLAVLMPMRI